MLCRSPKYCKHIRRIPVRILTDTSGSANFSTGIILTDFSTIFSSQSRRCLQRKLAKVDANLVSSRLPLPQTWPANHAALLIPLLLQNKFTMKLSAETSHLITTYHKKFIHRRQNMTCIFTSALARPELLLQKASLWHLVIPSPLLYYLLALQLHCRRVSEWLNVVVRR